MHAMHVAESLFWSKCDNTNTHFYQAPSQIIVNLALQYKTIGALLIF